MAVEIEQDKALAPGVLVRSATEVVDAEDRSPAPVMQRSKSEGATEKQDVEKLVAEAGDKIMRLLRVRNAFRRAVQRHREEAQGEGIEFKDDECDDHKDYASDEELSGYDESSDEDVAQQPRHQRRHSRAQVSRSLTYLFQPFDFLLISRSFESRRREPRTRVNDERGPCKFVWSQQFEQ